jgi:hypothetical protein
LRRNAVLAARILERQPQRLKAHESDVFLMARMQLLQALLLFRLLLKLL